MRHLIKVGLVLGLGAALSSRMSGQTSGVSQLLSLSVPVKSGTVLPTKCNNPSLFYKTNAGVPGQNIYACTAPDTWSLTGAGGVGTGTVTSVGFTGGLFSIANPTTTPAFTLAGTSGGIPYFSSASTWASSGALGANLPLFGGGAGAAPIAGTRQGNTTAVVTYAGSAPATNDCAKFDASGNVTTAGAACGSGGGGVPATSDNILIWDQTHTSSTLTLGTNCVSGHPCNVNGTSITGPIAVTITSSPGETEYIYINLANGHLVCGSNTAVLVCPGGDLVTGITAFPPAGAFPLYTAATTAAPAWTTITDMRSFLTKLALSSGANITCTYTDPYTVSCALASTVVYTGSWDASGASHTLPTKVGTIAGKPATCTVGELYFATDATAGANIYQCGSTNVWTAPAAGGGGNVTQTISYKVAGCILDASGSVNWTGNANIDTPSTGNSIARSCFSTTADDSGQAGLSLATGGDSFYTYTFFLPLNWVSSTNIGATVDYIPNGVNILTSITLKAMLQCRTEGDQAVVAASYNASSSLTFSPSVATVNLRHFASFTNLDKTGCVAGSEVRVKIERDGTDTYLFLVYALGGTFTYQTLN